MNRRTLLMSGAGLLCASGAAAREFLPLHESPRVLLSPKFSDQSGRALDLRSFLGRHILLNIWATWCAPCVEEMPAFDRLQRQLGGEKFQVVPISIDRGGLPTVQSFYRKNGITSLGIYIGDDLRTMLAFAITGLPTTMFIDSNGKELARFVGPKKWDSPSAIRQFRRYAIN